MAFNRATGKYLFTRFHNRGFFNASSYHNGRFYIPLFDFGAERGVLAITPEELLNAGDDSRERPLAPNMVEFPPEYRPNRALWGFTPISLRTWSDTMMVGFAGVPYLVLYRLTGEPVDTVTIPVRHRRGHPEGWLEIFTPGHDQLTTEQQVNAFSYLSSIWALSDGSTALWHQDNRVVKTSDAERIFGTAYISVLSADRRRACVDAPMEFPGTDWPIMTMHGDTVYAIDQGIEADSTKSYTVIRRYLIETNDCQWLEVKE